MPKPKKYSDIEEFEKKVNDYFEECEFRGKPKTMSGLALSLGLDRKTLVNYAHDDKYFPTIKKARQAVEAQNEELLLTGGNTAGVIFSLKNNFGWIDKSIQDTNHSFKQAFVVFEDSENGASESNDSREVSTAVN